MLLDPNPPLFPAAWACAWGEDAYGLWQAFTLNGVRQVMRWIPPGRFTMGSPPGEPERRDLERQHDVTLTRGLWLAETACTRALWQAVTNDDPSHFKDDPALPVEQVSWLDCQAFLTTANALLAEQAALVDLAERPVAPSAASATEPLVHQGLRLRLSTEAEWEYACRAGTSTAFSFGDALTTDQANFDGNFPYNGAPKGEYRQRTLPVHRFRPNHWGLYQMHGNVWEWCADWYGDYPTGPVTDPVGPVKGPGRVLRGGSWGNGGHDLRSAYRSRYPADYRSRSLGLRLAGG